MSDAAQGGRRTTSYVGLNFFSRAIPGPDPSDNRGLFSFVVCLVGLPAVLERLILARARRCGLLGYAVVVGRCGILGGSGGGTVPRCVGGGVRRVSSRRVPCNGERADQYGTSASPGDRWTPILPRSRCA